VYIVPLRVSEEGMRRFPAPWTVEAIDAGFKVIDANGQALAYVSVTPISAMLKPAMG